MTGRQRIHITPKHRRMNPYQLGELAANTTGSLRGMPYGPGQRQQDYIQGFTDRALALAALRDMRTIDAEEAA